LSGVKKLVKVKWGHDVGVFWRGGSVMYFVCSEGKRGVLGSKVGVLGSEVHMALTMESKAAFVHLNCNAIRVNKSFTFLSRTVNNYSFQSYCFSFVFVNSVLIMTVVSKVTNQVLSGHNRENIGNILEFIQQEGEAGTELIPLAKVYEL
jgi:hypothetical protein